MIEAYTVEQVQQAERALLATLPEGALMQRAATGLAQACARMLLRERAGVYGASVLLLVGKGNNGADALWAGAQLARRGAQVTAVCSGEPVPDAAAALRRAGGRFRDAAQVLSGEQAAAARDSRGVPYDLALDGLLGIGATGRPRPDVLAVLRLAAGARTLVAVDLPTGLDADTGKVWLDQAQFRPADLTVTFGCWKPGLLVGPAWLRHSVELIDIGLHPWLRSEAGAGARALETVDSAEHLTAGEPQEVDGQDKYTRGVVGVVAGSPSYPGAAVLAVGAALAAGGGMVRFAGAEEPAEQVRSRWPEAVVTQATGSRVIDAGRVQGWVVGPGLGTDEVAAEAIRAVLASDLPVVVDADALTVCAAHPEWIRDREAPTVITPHEREYARFGREVGDDRIEAARALAADLGGVVLLKGSATVIADPQGQVLVNRTGSAVLATAGTGDVLAGALGALLAGGAPASRAAASAAHLHGLAGQLSADGASTTAGRVLAAWPDAVRTVVAARLQR